MAAERIVEFSARVKVTVNDPDVIERFTGPDGDEVRESSYNLFTEEDVLAHLAYNCIANACENATMLDGFADLPADAVQMEQAGLYEMVEVEPAEAAA